MEKTPVQEHIERCVEIYANSDIDVAQDISRSDYEAMRADLLLTIGMLAALSHKD